MHSWRALALTVLLCTTALVAQSKTGRLTLKDYVAHLDQLATALEGSPQPQTLGALAIEVPATWQVEAQGSKFEVDNAWLIESLHHLSMGTDAERLQELQEFVAARRAGAIALLEPRGDSARSRAVLQSVLASREFHAATGPSWYDRLKQRVWRMVYSLLERIFGSSVTPMVGRVLAWGLVGVVFLIVGLWVYRTVKRGVRVESISPGLTPISARGWTAWLADARANAEKGRWREAIHFAYWAGISRLEEQGLWRPDRARTPREYLKLMPASSLHRSALTSLTSQFELVWYAGRPAGATEFSRFVTLLEQLGCR